jgi:hypothetical protein
MAALVYPRRTTSTATTITVSGGITWPQSVAVSSYASVPLVSTIASVSPSLSFVADGYIGASYSQNIVWNEDYGAGGGGLFTGGGHVTSDYPFAWVFDGSIPGWVALDTSGPTNALATNTTYATGAEASLTPANIPGGTLIADGYYCRPQAADPAYPTPYGYPAFDYMEFGEWSTGKPFGFHTWNSLFPIPPGVAGMGSKGGWGSICHHSMTRMSGRGVAWGHKIDAATGVWSRWPHRLPALTGINDMGACMRSCSDGTYAYTQWNYPTSNARNLVRTTLATGVHVSLPHANQAWATNNIVIIPGTTIVVSLYGAGSGLQGSGSQQATILATDVGSAGTNQVEVTMGSNTMPSGVYWDSAYQNTAGGFGQAGLAWVPEVGKLAAFHQAPAGSTNGTWPMKLYWITPPANVQSTWASGTWTVSEEALTIPGGDTKANNATNRGTYGNQYTSFAWSSKLRCFLHFPRPGTGMCFFIRTSLVP